jgi:quinol monooxygenase YgiN
MSVILTLSVEGNPAAVERYAAEHPDEMREIVDHAAQHGMIAHRFYGTEGKILVIDEWPDEQSFKDFFSEMQPQIQPIMEAAGASAEPQPSFWRKLETGDEYGWGA